MVKMSIGQFIAALRKANGMTQKQLGEKLNVSDKAVSRWERDECAPDLSLIPVIAEIFGVTSDEILRGERKSQDEEMPVKNSAKTQKQVERMVNDVKDKFSIRSIITVGIGFLGLIGAMISNFGFNRAYIGFFVGSILYLVGFVCETIFVKLAYSSLSNDELETEKVNKGRNTIFDIAVKTYICLILLVSITLPFIILPWDTYLGITFETWIGYGVLYGMIAFSICIFASWLAETIAVKNHIYTVSEEYYKKLVSLRKKSTLILVIVLTVIFICQSLFNSMSGANVFIKGRKFTDLDEFKTYIETPESYRYVENGVVITETVIGNLKNDIVSDDISDSENIDVNVDDYMGEDEGNKHDIRNSKGEVICEYEWKNKNVTVMDFDWEGEKLTITVYTSKDMIRKNNIEQVVNSIFVCLYAIGIICITIMYRTGKKRIE